MLNNRPAKIRFRLGSEKLADSAFFLYLCLPLIGMVFSKILSIVGLSSLSKLAALFITYFPLVLLFGIQRKNRAFDFWVLLAFIVFFFAVTYAFHPEYRYWFMREDYGVLNYVLLPDNGLYIYLFIRLVNDPKRILKVVKLSGWPMFAYYGWQLLNALSRGYWIDTSNRGYEIHLSYSLSLGYNVLLFALVFLYFALEEKKLSDWIGAFVGMLMILIGGSRGPFLDIAIFLVLYAFLKMERSRKKIIIIVNIIILTILMCLFYSYILAGISLILDKLNISSRFITKLLNGTIVDDTGRGQIWETAIGMIKENPLGYGAMGSRHVIGNLIYVGHPHQFFLEILIDFGVIFGSIIIIMLFAGSVKIFARKDIGEWKGVFIIFFARACQLLISLTYWHSIGLWGALAVGMCIHFTSKRRKQIHG